MSCSPRSHTLGTFTPRAPCKTDTRAPRRKARSVAPPPPRRSALWGRHRRHGNAIVQGSEGPRRGVTKAAGETRRPPRLQSLHVDSEARRTDVTVFEGRAGKRKMTSSLSVNTLYPVLSKRVRIYSVCLRAMKRPPSFDIVAWLSTNGIYRWKGNWLF